MLVRFSPLFSADGPPAEPLESPTITATVVLTGRVLTVTVTSLTGNPVPIVTAALTLDGAPTEFPLAGTGLYQIEVPGTDAVAYAGVLTAANGRLPNAEFSFSGTVPADAAIRTLDLPTISYTWTLPAPIMSRLSLTVTPEGQLIGAGSGTFTLSFTSPAEIVGTYANDASEEGGNAAFEFEDLATAPIAVMDPVITRTGIAPGGAQVKVGDTFTARRAIWAEDAADFATAQQTGQWRYGVTPIAGATGLTIVAPEPGGDLNYLDTHSGAGSTRTAASNTISVASGGRSLTLPPIAYTWALPAPTMSRDVVLPGDGSIIIAALSPLGPDLDAEPGDASIIITEA